MEGKVSGDPLQAAYLSLGGQIGRWAGDIPMKDLR